MIHTCANCGTEFTGRKKKFCDSQCSRDYRRRDTEGNGLIGFVDKASLGIKYTTKVNCKHCETLFKPRSGCGGDSNSMSTFCSRSCSSKYLSIRSENQLKVKAKELIDRKVKRILSTKTNKALRVKEQEKLNVLAQSCVGCSSSIIQGPKNCRKYCDDCLLIRVKASSKISRAINRHKYGSTRTHKERAYKYGVRYEVINRVKVFESFGWECQCCGVDTPKDIMKTFDEPNAPTLDHIKPISLGGDHMYYNLQLLCRSCNSSKSNDWRESEQSFIHKIYATGLPIVLTSKSCLGVGVYMHKNTISYS
jgi:5-methylcytosine-specific restriction endonuclease McrA